MPKNIFKVYQELDMFSIYIKGLVISIGLVISSNINTSWYGFAPQILYLRRAAQPPARYASLCRRYKVGCYAASFISSQREA